MDLVVGSVRVFLQAQDLQSLGSGWNQEIDQARGWFYHRHDAMLVGRDTIATEVVPGSKLDDQRRQFLITYIEPFRRWMPILPVSLSLGIVYFAKGVVSIGAAVLMQSPIDWWALTLGALLLTPLFQSLIPHFMRNVAIPIGSVAHNHAAKVAA